MGAASLAISGIVKILIELGVGIRQVKAVVSDLQTLVPDYEGISDADLIDIYAAKNNETRERLRAMLEE